MTAKKLVFAGCRCWTGQDSSPASAIAVDRGTIAAVGAQATMPPWPQVDLGGRTVMPGLVDSHCHLTSAATRRLRVGLAACVSLDHVLRDVCAWGASHQGDEWIRGWGWDQHRWVAPTLPSRHDLDRVVRDRPVWLARRDGHSAWLNTLAMERLGAPESAPADLLPLDADGSPVGIVRETLMDDLALRLPAHPENVHARVVMEEQDHLLSEGIVGVHTVERARGIGVLNRVAAGNDLRLRIYVMAEAIQPEECLQPDVPISPGGFKLFVDGSLGSGTAWMLGDDGTTGTPVTTGAELAGKVQAALEHGLDPCVHAIGDRAVREVADVFEGRRVSHPERFFRIEHVQHLDASDLSRLIGPNLLLSVQPCHLLSDRPVVAALPARPGRLDFAFGTMLAAGGNLLMGTDFPIEPSDPWRNIAAALERCDEGERPWHGEERLAWPAVLRAYSAAPSRMARWGRTGVLAPGFAADLLVVERDPGVAAPWHQRVCLTMIGGDPVYSDGSIDLP
ncbi:MAG: amidohydrolase [Candidatus Eisenbacteria bacterium]|nr:amidohydrolase [Candidatus Eisenbacteria bacterium]